MAEVQNGNKEAGEMTARFMNFVMMQAQNAAYLMGRIPTPDGQPIEPNLDMAKMFIDQLEMIELKTAGNLSKEEAQVLGNALGSLRMAFVETVHAIGGPGALSAAESMAQQQKSPPAPAPSPSPAPAPSASSSEEEGDGKRFVKKYS